MCVMSIQIPHINPSNGHDVKLAEQGKKQHPYTLAHTHIHATPAGTKNLARDGTQKPVFIDKLAMQSVQTV